MVPNPVALVTAVASFVSAKPNIGALAMNGLLVWGNHFDRSVILGRCLVRCWMELV